MILSEAQKNNILNKMYKNYLNHDCEICNNPVYKRDDFEVVVDKRKQTRLYHRRCLNENKK